MLDMKDVTFNIYIIMVKELHVRPFTRCLLYVANGSVKAHSFDLFMLFIMTQVGLVT